VGACDAWKTRPGHRIPSNSDQSLARLAACSRPPGKTRANEQIVEVVEFETTDPALRGEMTSFVADPDGGTTSARFTIDCHPAFRPPTTTPVGGIARLAALLEARVLTLVSDFSPAEGGPLRENESMRQTVR
jgi:hypothetical protein